MSMVSGTKSKNRKIPTVQLDYLIHIQEIKPWPPSQSLRTLRAVLIQWEYGDRNSGLTSQVVPSMGSGSGVGDGRIEFNESFRLPVTLSRELSGKGSNRDTFQKNCIEFNLFEPRRDKTVKGQLLGTAIVDLSDYAATKDTLCVSAAINCKRAYRNTSQPFLFLTIKSTDKIRGNLSSRDPLMRPSPIQKNFFDSVSALMSEEYAEEADTASFTDDDVSSHSSLTTTSSPAESNGVPLSQNKVSELEIVKASSGESEDVPTLTHDLSKSDEKQLAVSTASSQGDSSRLSSTDGNSDLERLTKNTGSSNAQFSSSSGPREVTEEDNSFNSLSSFSGPCEVKKGENSFNSIIGPHVEILGNIRQEVLPGVGLVTPDSSNAEKLDLIDSFYSCVKECAEHDVMVPSTKGIYQAENSNLTENDQVNTGGDKYPEKGPQKEIMNGCTEEQPGISFSQDGTWMDLSLVDASLSPDRDDKLKRVKSVRSSSNSNRCSELVGTSPFIRKNDRQDNKGHLVETRNGAQGSINRKENKGRLEEKRNIPSDNKLQHLEQRVKKLEWELTEAAAIEAALYSVVAEHGSSSNKVHAPARRLSRFYIHALKQNDQIGRASAARSSVSGLVLVAKACGNDVPRLTFWLSNSILLRSLITESLREEQLPFSVPVTGRNGKKNGNKESYSLKWQCPSTRGALSEYFDDWDWEYPQTLETALEKVEGWIFSRIIESIWWQAFTPRMQSGATNTMGMSVDEENGSFSLELWKTAFRDACDRICPVRAEGHECGCLPILSQLIMEQCVARLDVAMFNAILRESVDDIPTDPVSDPISDAEVLPIPAGKASFGAGAQLKNAIGNWSRWLTDLFGLDDDSTLENVNVDETSDDERSRQGTSLKSFHLLNALNDLMMLPKDLLLSRTVRKEVCPTLAPALIRRVLNIFVPDEFCPEQVPKIVLEALNSEDSFGAEENMVVDFPCPAARINYIPPLSADIVGNLRDGSCHSKLARSGSLLLTKSHASDDELDVLDSPLSSIYTDSTDTLLLNKPNWTLEEKKSHYTTRYQLLQKIWNLSE